MLEFSDTSFTLLGFCDPSWSRDSRCLLASAFSSHLRNHDPSPSYHMTAPPRPGHPPVSRVS